MTAPAASLSHVTFVNELGRVVLDDVSLRVEKGESVALVGHNGGGKTTLLRLLAGVVAPKSGRVEALGTDVTLMGYEAVRRHRIRVGFVFEAGGLWANRTIADNIALPLYYHPRPPLAPAEIHARVRAVAEELDIAPDLDVASFRVNASVRKRALVARALVLEPELLLVDEPQVGLVAKEARLVADAIERRRSSRKMTLVFANHDGYLDPYVADRTYYFENGRLLDRPSALPPPDRPRELGVLPEALGGASVLGGVA